MLGGGTESTYAPDDPAPSRAAPYMRHRRTPTDELRLAIDCLPVRTREAMLLGIRESDIIVGAYTDRRGGVCPMLAAHRRGGRTNFIAFARAWDRFAGAKRARLATSRELRVLEAQLEASLLRDGPDLDLGAAIADHQAAARERRSREARETGLTPAPGWLRGRRSRRDAERALARVEARAALRPREDAGAPADPDLVGR
ncbi:MAG: hypothetical protein QOH43_73 [Solirubrobacteraceae bacterium]|nr:hypothetical protein [Solirubrobacteraceae bacterium]